MKKNDNKRILCFGFLLILLFLVLIIIVSKGKKDLYYIMYRTSESKTYCSEAVKLAKKDLINDYSKYTYVVAEKILLDSGKTYDKKDFNELFSTINNDLIFKLSEKTYLSSYDIVANNLINLERNDFDYNKLNSYLLDHDNYEVFNDLNSVTSYEMESYFLENKKMIALEKGPLYKIKNTSTKLKNIDNIITNASNRLVSMQHDGGSFVYGYYVLSGRKVSGYNALRHVGTVWSLILSYKEFPREELKSSIVKALDFMKQYYVYYDEKNTTNAYLTSSNQLNIGGNGLAVLALAEYEKVFNDTRYHDLACDLANGILASQSEDGHLTHTFNMDLTIDSDFVVSYYDGEAIFGLMKLYEVTGNELYYDAVVKALNYFINNGYEKYKDHWIAYSLNEFVRYNHEEKYIEFLMKHFNKKNNENHNFIPARVEALMSIYDAYDYLMGLNIDSPTLKKVDRQVLLESVDITINNLLRFYIDDEVLIYLNNPDKVSYGFYASHDDNRMRIDDIQHTLGALIHYKNLKDNKKLNY